MFANSLTKFDAAKIYNQIFWNANRKASQQSSSRPQSGDYVKIREYIEKQRVEPNPEYHCAPRCFVMNYRKHQRRENVSEMQNIEKTPKFLWADFRRRMIYGTYDI
ncbi:uncharacterized protein LOC108595865 [Drosophila busckii]|nr:uncharacterized protein LOC108595865 [Drosophila busckii]